MTNIILLAGSSGGETLLFGVGPLDHDDSSYTSRSIGRVETIDSLIDCSSHYYCCDPNTTFVMTIQATCCPQIDHFGLLKAFWGDILVDPAATHGETLL